MTELHPTILRLLALFTLAAIPFAGCQASAPVAPAVTLSSADAGFAGAAGQEAASQIASLPAIANSDLALFIRLLPADHSDAISPAEAHARAVAMWGPMAEALAGMTDSRVRAFAAPATNASPAESFPIPKALLESTPPENVRVERIIDLVTRIDMLDRPAPAPDVLFYDLTVRAAATDLQLTRLILDDRRFQGSPQ